LTLSNSTIVGNGQEFYGAIWAVYPSTNYFLSSIISGNLISVSIESDFYGVAISLGHNLIGNGTNASGFLISDQVGTTTTPIDPKVGVLANNGGSTQTLVLLTGSPAIGKGDCTGNTTVNPPAPAVTTDQRGVKRKSPCDIGAYETTAAQLDTIGIYRGNTFYLRLHNSQGNADTLVAYTAGRKPYPVVGDWTGAGYDTIGLYDQASGNFYLRNSNTSGYADESFTLGNPNDMPLSGRWSIAASHAGVGVYRPTNGILYLKNDLTSGYSDNAEVFGVPGDVGVAGDWTAKGYRSVGVYRPALGRFYLSNQITDGIIYGDINYGFGMGSPFTGDWIGQGYTSVGLFAPTTGTMYLHNGAAGGSADAVFVYGSPGDAPIAGHWQATYPPVAPHNAAPILIPKTAVPQPTPINGSAPGSNQIGG